MQEVFKQVMDNVYAIKRECIRRNLIRYYMTLSENDVMIPAFILANEDIKLLEKNGKVEEWYKKMMEN